MKEKIEFRSKILSMELKINYCGNDLLQIVLDNKNYDRLLFDNESLIHFNQLGKEWMKNKEQVFELTCEVLDNKKYNLYSFYGQEQFEGMFLQAMMNEQN